MRELARAAPDRRSRLRTAWSRTGCAPSFDVRGRIEQAEEAAPACTSIDARVRLAEIALVSGPNGPWASERFRGVIDRWFHGRRTRLTLLAAAMACASSAAHAQSRSDENAVTQAEDAFGFSVGRESLGIYNAGNARGFSPTAAGNIRIDGLYFDQMYNLAGTVLNSTSIKVGLSAQGYPFAAPSGIVDLSLRRPDDKSGASVVTNFDSFGSLGVEVDGSLPVSSTLSLGYGLNGTHVEFPDGTSNWNHTESLIARWRPAAGIEIMPFYAITNDYDDEAGTFYVPAGQIPAQAAQVAAQRGSGLGRLSLHGRERGRPCVGADRAELADPSRRLPVDQRREARLHQHPCRRAARRQRRAHPVRRPACQGGIEQRRAAADPQHSRRAAPSRHQPQPARARRPARVRRIGLHRLRPGPDRRKSAGPGAGAIPFRRDQPRPRPPDHARRGL